MHKDNRSNMTFREWLTIATHSVMTAALDIKKFSRPYEVGGHKTPKDLTAMTLGQMFTLSSAKRAQDAFVLPCTVLLGMSEDEVYKSLAVDVVRFGGWVSHQLDTINDLWAKLRPTYTSQEKRAGVDALKFGAFGVADWYARRMGIANHDDVMDVCWMRVYQCMKIDSETAKYQRRLQQIYIQEARRRK